MKVFKNGLITGLLLQLAIGPVFFYLINLTLQKTFWDGIVGAIAVTLADYFYIALAILGIGKLIKKDSVKKGLSLIGPLVLIIFGVMIVKEIFSMMTLSNVPIISKDLTASFVYVFLLTILSPMTIIFWTGFFATKTLEYNYNRRELFVFGVSTGLATLLFMSASVIIIFFVKEIVTIPLIVVQILNGLVGCVLIGYGAIRLKSSVVQYY